uniref:Uncharacterized protein n=1 Tax=Rhizophora mucronata TaxID=61149 RepID=A0A2P2P272_RHIMU
MEKYIYVNNLSTKSLQNLYEQLYQYNSSGDIRCSSSCWIIPQTDSFLGWVDH